MEQTATRRSFVAACLDRRMLLQRIGLVVFLASMPLDVLNGHGRGMIADYDHFQGWEVAWMGLFFSLWVSLGEWSAVFFFPIAILTAFTLTMPFVDLSQPGVGSRIARVLKTIGLVSFVVTAIGILGWAVADPSEFHGERGAFWGAIPWLVGPALVLIGTLRQKPQKAPARRRWSFSLRTLFVAMTALALFSAIIGTYHILPGPVVLLGVLVAAMAAPAFLRAADLPVDRAPGNDGSGDSLAP